MSATIGPLVPSDEGFNHQIVATVDGTSMIGAGHYDDEYVRGDGIWQFRSRTLRLTHLVPLRDGWAEQPPKP